MKTRRKTSVACDCVNTALLWMTWGYAGNAFEMYIRDLSSALDEADDRALQAEQGAMSGAVHLSRTIFRSSSTGGHHI